MAARKPEPVLSVPIPPVGEDEEERKRKRTPQTGAGGSFDPFYLERLLQAAAAQQDSDRLNLEALSRAGMPSEGQVALDPFAISNVTAPGREALAGYASLVTGDVVGPGEYEALGRAGMDIPGPRPIPAPLPGQDFWQRGEQLYREAPTASISGLLAMGLDPTNLLPGVGFGGDIARLGAGVGRKAAGLAGKGAREVAPELRRLAASEAGGLRLGKAARQEAEEALGELRKFAAETDDYLTFTDEAKELGRKPLTNALKLAGYEPEPRGPWGAAKNFFDDIKAGNQPTLPLAQAV